MSQIRRYVGFFGWLLTDVVRQNVALVVTMQVVNFGGLLAQSLVFVLIFGYAHLMETGRTVSAWGYTLAPQGSYTVLLGVAIASLALLVGASFGIFKARVLALELQRRYSNMCFERILVSAATLPRPGASTANRRIGPDAGIAALLSQARSAGTAARMFLNLTLPSGRAILATAALFYLDAMMSGIVLAVVVLCLLPLYWIGVSGAVLNKKMGKTAALTAPDRNILINRVLGQTDALLHEHPELRRVVDQGGWGQLTLMFFRQRQAIERAAFVSRVSTAIPLFLILSVQGASILEGQGGWSELIAYLGALRILAAAIPAIGRPLTAVNRIYPAVRDLSDFFRSASRRPPASIKSEAAAMRIDAIRLDGGEGDIVLRVGSRSALVLSDPLSREMLVGLIESSHCDGIADAPTFVPHIRDDDDGTYYQSALAEAARSKNPIVVISASGLSKLDEAQVRSALDRIRDRIVFIAYDVSRLEEIAPGHFDDTICILSNGVAVQGAATCTFVNANLALVRSKLRTVRRKIPTIEAEEEDFDAG